MKGKKPKITRQKGRPTKLTPELQDEFCSWLRAGNYIETTCHLMKISKQSVYGWMKKGKTEKTGKHKRFLDAVRQAQGVAEANMLAIIDNASKKDWRAVAWRLERIRPSRYMPQQRVELTGKGGKAIETKRSVDDLTDEELAKIAGGA